MCQRYDGRTITGQIKITHVKVISAEADLPTIATRATQVSTIAMEMSLWMPDANLRRQIATAEVRQCSKKTSRRKKPARYGDLSLGPHNQKGLWGSSHPGYKLETTFSRWMVQSGETEKDKTWA